MDTITYKPIIFELLRYCRLATTAISEECGNVSACIRGKRVTTKTG